MTLEVIGVGMPRTGTLSLKTALEQLGFGPCHHMVELFAHPEQWPHWNRIGDGEDIEWEDIFGRYRAVTDAPGVYFWRDLVERYPDAKVILTERDPERWYDSMQSTIFSPKHREIMGATPVGALIGKLAQRSWPGRNSNLSHGPPPRELMVKMFNDHSDAVRAEIAPERLLVYQVAQGWGPLCDFLGVPIPETDFPRLNSSEEFHGIDVPA
jgi:hypothetical protein